jgi:hypothetical protein
VANCPSCLCVGSEERSVLSHSSPASLVNRDLRRKVYNTPKWRSESMIEQEIIRRGSEKEGGHVVEHRRMPSVTLIQQRI